ncbi:DNA polymerase iota-like [Homarus americanus]|uniref:DNA polymerase iota-like n=1 Tax=Homarus americanus TaxID=6706 RepID=UPI001C473E97|nr:DNA polymerase iota-like [Homarus americanus]
MINVYSDHQVTREESHGEQEDEWALIPDHHQRTILHVDVDCFYAQVEMVRDPGLRDKPLGIKQKNLMVTCNYVARSLGVKKSMWLKDALEILPSLVLVDGSDLTHYRQFSSEISAVAQTFTPHVERLGLDENFIDVTDIIGDYLNNSEIEGHVFGDKDDNQVHHSDPCGCGCYTRLVAGTHIAKELRQQIYETTGITCCAGVAHNKLLAKLVSGYHKPNQQTVLFPWQVHEMMKSLNLTRSIPGIGSVTYKALEDLGISTVQQLQNSVLKLLMTKFDQETSQKLKDLSFGIDKTPVRKSGRPQSIGLEDAFRKITCITAVRVKYYTLLERLLKLLADDGRIPASLKVSVRKFDRVKRFGHRETKQVPVSSSVFTMGVKGVNEDTKSYLMNMIMGLFHKMVDTKKDFHLTLVGVGFNKFIERAQDAQAISNFFSKRTRQQTDDQNSECKDSNVTKRTKFHHSPTNRKVLESFTAESSMVSSEENSSRFSSDEDCIEENFKDIYENPALLGTHINLEELDNYKGDKEVEEVIENASETRKELISPEIKMCVSDDRSCSEKSACIRLPNGIDREVFSALPGELQQEILLASENKQNPKVVKQGKVLKPKQTNHRKSNSVNSKTIKNYFKPQVSVSFHKQSIKDEQVHSSASVQDSNSECNTHEDLKASESSCSYSVVEGLTPKLSDEKKVEAHLPGEGIDLTVFSALPKYIQDEIIQEQKCLKEAPASPQPKGTLLSNARNAGGPVSILKYFKKL